jgi:NDP-sugar pyrophosphorylase family protein
MGEPAESVSSLYPQLIHSRPGCVRGFVCDATFHDIGTPGDYLCTALSLASEEGGRASLVGRGVSIDPSATVTDSVIWDNVSVQAGLVLDRCILADGVTVHAEARFDNAALVPRFAGYTPLAGEEIVGNLLVRRF